jgi:hypothetical protein
MCGRSVSEGVFVAIMTLLSEFTVREFGQDETRLRRDAPAW